MANTYAIRSVTSPENFTKLTVSCWFKGKQDGTQRGIWGIYDSASTTKFFGIYYSSNGSLYAYWRQGGSGIIFTLGTMQKFNDPNAWYHLVLTMDTTLATASDRVKMYINGERITVFEDSLDTITQDFDCANLGDTNGRIQWGGNVISGTQYYWNGLLSHCHMCVGYAYQASSFGETDATTGEWKINTSPSVSYGTNGGFWFKDGNQLTDSSTNSNTLTVGGGTLTKTEDCPSNVFATWNPLDHKSTGWNMQNGNTRLQGTGGDSWETRRAISTIGASSGKYYAELKMTTAGNDSYPFGVGYDVFENSYSSSMGSNSNFWGYYQPSGGQIYGGGTGSPLETSLGGGTGDIIGIALDIDNSTLQFYKNGSTMGSQITGLPSGKTWFFASSGYGNTNTFDANFGNGYFGSTQISSAGTNASGIGIFEYDVPTGFTALSTKGLNL